MLVDLPSLGIIPCMDEKLGELQSLLSPLIKASISGLAAELISIDAIANQMSNEIVACARTDKRDQVYSPDQYTLSLNPQDFEELSKLTDGYSGSDIEILCREAIMRPIRDLDKGGDLGKEGKIVVRPVVIGDFLSSLEKIKATVSQDELKKFKTWIEEFGG